jgi:uncharacterized protein (DUF2141 family)
VEGVRDANGSVLDTIYDREANFLKPALAISRQKVKSSKGELTFVFHDLPAGTYAVAFVSGRRRQRQAQD